ncbi:MAG: FAD-binding oxidoreductase [Bacillota bacterium]
MSTGDSSRALSRDLRKILSPRQVLDSMEDRVVYAFDATTLQCLPDVVVKAGSARDVSAVLKLAGSLKVPVVPRGAGTGLSGGSVPDGGGIALVLTGMRNIKEVDAENMVAVCEPGVITADLKKAAEHRGLFYPPDPSSLNYSTIGGNIAENAGGPHGIKYGVTKDYVMGLEVVLASGDIVRLGGKQVKNVTGYNLVQLFIGSEGTLGVITEAILRLIPLPPARRTASAAFNRLEQAAETVTAILNSGIVPSTLELMDQKSINYVEDFLGLGLSRHAEAMLLIEVDGMDEAVTAEMSRIARICREMNAESFTIARHGAEAEQLRRARQAVSPAISRVRPTKIGEDICVPRSAIPAMVREIQKIGERYGLPIVIFGHAGDGNLHPNILTDKRDHEEMLKVNRAIHDLFESAVRLGGTLSGEHGIGLTKKPYLKMDLSPETINLMGSIKRTLDPLGILNPNKIFGGVSD